MAVLPKFSKINPGIAPKNIMGSSGTKVGGIKSPGRKKSPLVQNISSKNLFSNIQRRSPEVANTRGARTLTNLMSTFGTPRNEKVIRRELQLLRNSLVETFEIAKLLRTSLNTVGGKDGEGSGTAKAGLLGGAAIALWAWWKKTFGKKDKGDDGGEDINGSGEVQVDTEGVEENLQEAGKNISKVVPPEVEEGETEETNNILQPVRSFFEGLAWGKLETFGKILPIAGATIMGILKLFNPFSWGPALAKKFGLDGDESEIASSGNTTTNEEDLASNETDWTKGVTNDETLIASTDTKGLLSNNFDGMNSESVTGKNSKNKKKDKLNLSDQDFKDLGLAVSGEAERGTDDELAVAASILNRVASPNFPNTVGGVIKSKTADGKHEYEAFDKGTAVHDKKLVDFLKSDEGQKGIIEALERLQGRTDFKGQDQLKNRVPEEDPMFSKKGNFFHYFWQSGDGRTKPENWEMPNYNQFINDNQIKGKKNGDVSSLSSLTDTSGFFPLILGGVNGSVASSPSTTRVVDPSTPRSNRPDLEFLDTSNPDSSNLSFKALLNITG